MPELVHGELMKFEPRDTVIFTFHVDPKDHERVRYLLGVMEAFNEGVQPVIKDNVGVISDGSHEAPATEAKAPDSTPAKTTKAAKPPQDYQVFRPDGSLRAGYSHSKDAADVLIITGSECTTAEQLGAMIDANAKTMARLANEDQERVKAALAPLATTLRAAAKPASAEPDLDALLGGDEKSDTAPPPTIDEKEFMARMAKFVQEAGPVAAKTFGQPIIKKYGALSKVPPEDYQLVLDASTEFLAKVKQ